MCCWLDGPFWSAPKPTSLKHCRGLPLVCGDEGARQDSVFIKKDQSVRRWSNLARCCKSRKRHDSLQTVVFHPSSGSHLLGQAEKADPSRSPTPGYVRAGMPDLKAELHTRYCGITECAVEGRYLHNPSSAPTSSCIADDEQRPVSKISWPQPLLGPSSGRMAPINFPNQRTYLGRRPI